MAEHWEKNSEGMAINQSQSNFLPDTLVKFHINLPNTILCYTVRCQHNSQMLSHRTVNRCYIISRANKLDLQKFLEQFNTSKSIFLVHIEFKNRSIVKFIADASIYDRICVPHTRFNPEPKQERNISWMKFSNVLSDTNLNSWIPNPEFLSLPTSNLKKMLNSGP